MLHLLELYHPDGEPKLFRPPGLSQSRGLCKSLGLTPAASGGKRDFGVWLVGCADQPHPKPHSVKLLCESRVFPGCLSGRQPSPKGNVARSLFYMINMIILPILTFDYRRVKTKQLRNQAVGMLPKLQHGGRNEKKSNSEYEKKFPWISWVW